MLTSLDPWEPVKASHWSPIHNLNGVQVGDGNALEVNKQANQVRGRKQKTLSEVNQLASHLSGNELCVLEGRGTLALLGDAGAIICVVNRSIYRSDT